MDDIEDISRFVGLEVISAAGETVGHVEEVFVSSQSERPSWARVNMRDEAQRSAFVPLDRAVADAGAVHVPFDRQTVVDASTLDPTAVPEQRAELAEHYGFIKPAGPPWGFP